MLEEQFFDPKLHDRAGFNSGEPALDEFLRKYASQQRSRGLTSWHASSFTTATR